MAAFKATWVEDLSLDPNTGLPLLDNPVSTRIVLYKLYDGTAATTDGGFGIRIEYGSVYNGGSGHNGIVGFRLGSDADSKVESASSGTPTLISDTTDYYYEFRNGHLVGAVVDTDGEGHRRRRQPEDPAARRAEVHGEVHAQALLAALRRRPRRPAIVRGVEPRLRGAVPPI